MENISKIPDRDFIDASSFAPQAIKKVQKIFPEISDYRAIHYLINHETFALEQPVQDAIENIEAETNFNPSKTQAEEILQRYGKIKNIMQQTVVEADPLHKALFTQKLDDILLHRTWGYLILFVVLFSLFQSIFLLAQFPMDGIEWTFAKAGGWLGDVLPSRLVQRSFYKWHTCRIKRNIGFCSANNDLIRIDNIIGRHRLYGKNKLPNG